ncbi:ferredoxin reductase [Fontimonas sp. SYSU GA230001]|uniref:ferredoxin reductase n=1 Tax=Fontimonas sp. SYSU GA230001 TaxID=3142450 RepID=UPI0032B318DE
MAFDLSSAPRRVLARFAAALSYPLTPADYFGTVRADGDALQGSVESVRRAAPDAVTLTIRPGRGFARHVAGQFVRIGIDIDGVRHWRCYSISSAPERADGCFTLTVKAVPGGRVSTYIVDRLAVGARVQLSEPAGAFTLPERLPARLLFVTAGSGITPVMSMLASLDARGVMPYATVIHCAPDADQMIHGDELARLAERHPRLRLHRIYTRQSGRFTPEQLETLCPEWRLSETWACGPDALLQTLEAHWQQAGIAGQLHVERFRPRQLAGVPADAAVTVRFARSGCSAAGRGDQPVLELAELQGLAPASGCRMGICHGCIATLRSGAVRDLRDGTVHAEEGDQVQICVCAPVGDVEIEL